MVFIRSDKKGTRSQRIMRNIIWKSIQNRPVQVVPVSCYEPDENI